MSAINLSATCNPKCLHFHDCDGLECHLYNYAICKTMQYINTLFSWDIKHVAFLMSLWHRILYLKSVVYDETFSWLCFNPLIVIQSTGFYMIGTSIMKELRILSNIFEGIFLQQQSTAFGRQLFSQKVPSSLFESILNTPLHILYCKSNQTFSKDCRGNASPRNY